MTQSKTSQPSEVIGPQISANEMFDDSGVRSNISVPLNLKTLLSPYKGHGRLIIRIERLPQLSRLSAGKNNGDGSWSLAADEIDELHYFPPSNCDQRHDLAIRVISITEGGATLAVLTLPVDLNSSSMGSAINAGPEPAFSNSPAISELSDLRQDLETTTVALSCRNKDLWETKARVEELESLLERERVKHQEDLESERTACAAELEQRLIKERSIHAQAVAQVERFKREDFEKLSADAERRIADERDACQAAAQQALAEAESKWQDTQRLHLQREKESWQASAEIEVNSYKDTINNQTKELARLEGLVSQLEAHLEERAERRIADERDSCQVAAQQALAEAESKWKDAQRLHLQREKESWQASAEIEVNSYKDTINNQTKELTRLEGLVSQLEAHLEDRNADLERLHKSLQDSYSCDEQCTDAPANAPIHRQEGVIGESGLNDAVPTEIGEYSTGIMDGTNRFDSFENVNIKIAAHARELERDDIQQLKAECESLRKAMDASEEELKRERDTIAEERSAIKQEWQEKMFVERQRIARDADSRTSEIEKEFEQRLEKSLATAAARYERAEQALSELRSERSMDLSRESAEVIRLREELASVRNALARRSSESTVVSSHWGSRADERNGSSIVELRRDVTGANRAEAERKRRRSIHNVRDVLAVACLAAIAVIFYPKLEAMLPTVRSPDVAGSPTSDTGTTSSEPQEIPSPQHSVSQIARVVRRANVRSMPSTESVVVTVLDAGATVVVLDRHGDWIRIGQGTDLGAPRELGWVFGPLLHEVKSSAGKAG